MVVNSHVLRCLVVRKLGGTLAPSQKWLLATLPRPFLYSSGSKAPAEDRMSEVKRYPAAKRTPLLPRPEALIV